MRELLIDFVRSYMTSCSHKPKVQADTPRTTAEVLEEAKRRAKTPGTDLQKQSDEMSFRMGVVAVTCLRYLSEHIQKLPLSAMTRILDTHGT